MGKSIRSGSNWHAIWHYFGTNQSLSIVTYLAFGIALVTYFVQGNERRENREEHNRVRKFDSYTQLLARCWMEHDGLITRITRTKATIGYVLKRGIAPRPSSLANVRNIQQQYISAIKLRLWESKALKDLISEWSVLIIKGYVTCESLEEAFQGGKISKNQVGNAILKANETLDKIPADLTEQIRKIAQQMNKEIAER